MVVQDLLSRGRLALRAADWELARESFEEAARLDPTAEAFDGLGRALWWLKDVRGSIEFRTRAYREYKRLGRSDAAAAVAVWLARELRTLFGNDAAADGWMARAETLVSETSGSAVSGWVCLARAEATSDVSDSIAQCRMAIELAHQYNDPDLEMVALARLGLLQVAGGEVEAGVTRLDEAMAAATAGEAGDPQSVGSAYCALMEAAELLGDSERFAQWTSAIAAVYGGHGFGPLDMGGSITSHGNLSTFCGTCCGGMYLATGRLDDAEDELRAAIADLASHGMQSRCVHPVTQLAELRVIQGRFEEARDMLARFEDLPECVRPLAVLNLALGFADEASARLTARLESMGDLTVAALPLWTVQVDAQLGRGDHEAADRAAAQVRRVAMLTGSKRHEAEACFATGKWSRPARGTTPPRCCAEPL